MTRTAKKMFQDMGYEYSEKYTADDEKALEYIQYEKECEIIKFYIAGKFWGKCHKKGVFGSKYEYDKYAYATAEETEAIIQQCKELDWIAEASKSETNFEHYFEKIKELVSLYYFRPQTIANGLMALDLIQYKHNKTTLSSIDKEQFVKALKKQGFVDYQKKESEVYHDR